MTSSSQVPDVCEAAAEDGCLEIVSSDNGLFSPAHCCLVSFTIIMIWWNQCDLTKRDLGFCRKPADVSAWINPTPALWNRPLGNCRSWEYLYMFGFACRWGDRHQTGTDPEVCEAPMDPACWLILPVWYEWIQFKASCEYSSTTATSIIYFFTSAIIVHTSGFEV